MAVIEKKGLYQAAEILENYGINSETDVSMLDRDDFCKLVSGGLRPSEAWASFRVTRSMFSPWNHILMERQLQLL
jgi:hypothetical protein